MYERTEPCVRRIMGTCWITGYAQKGAQVWWQCYWGYFSRRKTCMCVYSRKMNSLVKYFFIWISAPVTKSMTQGCSRVFMWPQCLAIPAVLPASHGLPRWPPHQGESATGDNQTFPPDHPLASTAPEIHLCPTRVPQSKAGGRPHPGEISLQEGMWWRELGACIKSQCKSLSATVTFQANHLRLLSLRLF